MFNAFFLIKFILVISIFGTVCNFNRYFAAVKKQTLLFLSLTIILTSCNHYYYVSSVQNVPLFREKNEFHLATTYAIGDESESGELQTAYSITNHIGIMANFMITKIGSEEKFDYVNGKNFDIGLGYFKTIGKNAVFEVYSGYSNDHVLNFSGEQ